MVITISLMRKFRLLFFFFTFCSVSLFSQQEGIIADILRESAEQKVITMQRLIAFDDSLVKRLTKVEVDFLFDVRKVESCWLCNRKKRIEKLQRKREEELQRILPRNQYLKYRLIEAEAIQKGPLRVEGD